MDQTSFGDYIKQLGVMRNGLKDVDSTILTFIEFLDNLRTGKIRGGHIQGIDEVPKVLNDMTKNYSSLLKSYYKNLRY